VNGQEAVTIAMRGRTDGYADIRGAACL